MGASASANELSVETRRADVHTIAIITGRVTVESSPRLRPVLLEAATLAAPRGVPLAVIRLGGETSFVAVQFT